MSNPSPMRWHRRWLVPVLTLVLCAGVPTLGIVALVQARQISGLSAGLAAQRQQAQQAGQTPVARPPSEVRQDPARPLTTPVPGPTGERGPGPTDEQVAAAVAEYFRAHPVAGGKDPSPAQIAAAVVNYLRKHPPAQGEQGPGPSAEQVATAVGDYLTAHPPAAGPKGDQGERGEQGPGPTAEQLADAVRSYLTENPPPSCPDGYELRAEQVLTATGPRDAVLCEHT